MTAGSTTLFSPSQLQARACQWVGICLIGVFLINLLGSFLPPQILDPDWQLALMANLIDNGAYPLLGLLLIGLAAYLEPDNSALQRRQQRLRALGCWVSVAYLLLIPLIGLTCKRGLDRATFNIQRDAQNAEKAIVTLRTAIISSSNLAELQGRFRALQAPALPADAASLPMTELKSGLLQRLKSNENELKQEQRQPILIRFLPILQKAFRNILGCLVLAVGFAAVALPKGASRSQLQSCCAAFDGVNQQSSQWTKQWRNWQGKAKERREKSQRMANVRRAQRQAQRRSGGDTAMRGLAWLGRIQRRSKPKSHSHDYLRQISKDRD